MPALSDRAPLTTPMDSFSSWLNLQTMDDQVSPSKARRFSFLPLVFLLLSLNLAETTPISTHDFGSSYHRHCSDVVPPSPTDSDEFFSGELGLPSVLRTGYFRGGAPLLGEGSSKFFFFNVHNAQKTASNGVYQFMGRLTLAASSPPPPHNSSSFSSASGRHDPRLVRFRGPAVWTRRAQLSFYLKGFWSESSQKLCMVGADTASSSSSSSNGDYLLVVLKLRYPRNSTVYTSLVTGSLESFDGRKFSPISLLAMPQVSEYDYTLMEKDDGNGCQDGGDRALSLPDSGCSVLNRVERFELKYGEGCNGFECSPLGSDSGFVPRYMFLYRTHCSKEKKWRVLLGFPNSSFSFARFPFDPSTTLVAEGAWNEKGNRFCAVACRILDVAGSLDKARVGDCATRFSLNFPASLSLRSWSNIVGEVWSAGAVNGSGHFNKIGFNSFSEKVMDILRFKYEYSSDETVAKTCSEKKAAKGKGKVYPDEYSWDMTFGMSVRNGEGQVASGYSTPIYVGNQLFGNRFFPFRNFSPQVRVQPNTSPKSPVNITYRMSLTLPNDFKLGHNSSSSSELKISGEGTYDKGTGMLCMVGCRRVGSRSQTSVKNDTLDCEIVITVQFSPLDKKTGKNIKGRIESTRPKSDPLNFGRLEISSNSIYTEQAASSIWRMDFELIMVLISKTLTCVLVGVQLFYAKSHPDVLPFSSVAMLVVLTVGHMIPLLLNFEALFASHHIPQNDFLRSGGWLEANEVIVRIVTMVAFLLQLRLLHLTWSSRQGNASEKNLWNSESKVLFITVPLYVIGAVISWYINQLKNSHTFPKRAFPNPHRLNYVVTTFKRRSFQKHSLWSDLKSYAGLVMDGFLLPQILFNFLLDSRERALAPSFYAGTTLVRLLPHAYDLYRAHAYSKYLDLSYIYASHRLDYYSTAWNIVIPCGGILFAVSVFLQQRFGGRCFLRGRCSQYEKVSVISNEDL